MSSNDDSDFEQVEDEPAPTTKSGAVGTHATRTKIDLKLITIKPFDGSTKDGFIDPGAYDWLERLKVQIHLAETLTERKWPETVKCGVLASRLTSEAGTWYYRNSSNLPKDSFCDLANKFMENFRCKLPVQTIAVTLANTRKFPQETYATYAHRLSQIAAGLNRGKANSYTEQQALSTFINHAYPRFRVDLEAKLDQEAEDATGELESAVVLLTKLAKSDGKINPNKRRSEDFSRDGSDKKPRISGSASATTAKAPRPRWDFSDALCKTCNERGYTTNYHDRHVAQQARSREVQGEQNENHD
ncbi:hypothetical protein GN958_ATG05316 [Phytophthora infestans]|uniref:Retrotransposon gag domain-containing protein n=1 Tax=Phytophthora infestans TaxID=4787 RepID=A0A8S9UYU1_PHYIN|nr:hypothetical protein GN958_ATG05316 [Phytophthora infestans]